MKTIMTTILLLTVANTALANPLLLKCRINNQAIEMDIESLVSTGCETKVIPAKDGLLNTRYIVSLCQSQYAEGVVEVMTSAGSWAEAAHFSTQENCYLFRKIETNYPCQPSRHGSRGDCQ